MTGFANEYMFNGTVDLIEAIEKDYTKWCDRQGFELGDLIKRPWQEKEWKFEIGRKYIKIVQETPGQNCVWGFIVNGPDKKFNMGDILMAAGWSAPARNKARGNVIDGTFDAVRWTGPEYLR